MSTRQEITLRFKVGERMVTVKAMDAVGVEDCYENLMKAVLHRYVTGEDLVTPIPREIKDWLVKTNLNI